MNSISDPHLNKRISAFREKGHEVKVYGFDRCNGNAYDNHAEILGVFPNTMGYAKRIRIYLKGIKALFDTLTDNCGIWYYQGLDVAMFATLFNPNKKYIYEECDLVHAYVGNAFLYRCLEWLDKRIIRHSLKTVVTSEGFLDYHYGSGMPYPENILLIPNKLPRCLAHMKCVGASKFDFSHIRFAFVGGLRYKSLVSVAGIISRNFPQHEFHFYGFVSPVISLGDLPSGANVFYHGRFKSPDDLPQIYSNVDVVVSTYDLSSLNVWYAEPNKLYEAIYFRRPIIVSRGTFLERKVLRMGIGYSVNPYDEQDVVKMVRMVEHDYERKKEALSQISREEALDGDNADLIINGLV